MKKFAFLFCACMLLFGCSSEKSNQLEDEYDSAYKAMKALKEKLDYPSSVNNDSLVRVLMEEDQALSFDFNKSEASEDDVEKFQKLHDDIEDIHTRVKHFLDKNISNVKCIKVHEDGKLLETSAFYPVYLERGETMCMDVEFEKMGSVFLYNADSKAVQLSKSKKQSIHESFTAKYSAIYLVEICPKGTTYASIDIYVRTTNPETILHPVRIKSESETTKKGAFMATEIHGIKMQNIFEEPRKFTLRGQLKAAFSGSYRGMVAIQVPKGAKDILYSLRISTNETPVEEDGEFKKNMDTSYHKIRFLGLPIYESSRSIGLINTLLGENVPPREEDAYINMYVFYNAAQARKFQNGAETKKCKYNLDYSTIGTQSCNGRIPTKGHNTVYLAFENERMRYNNYVWLEAVGSVPNTEYVRMKYSKVSQDENNDENEDYYAE